MLGQQPIYATIAVATICIATTVLGSVFTLSTVARYRREQEIKQALSTYEDEDGKASPVAIAAFSSLLPRVVLVFSLLAALITSVERLNSLDIWTQWVSTAAWALVLAQAAVLHGVKSPVLRFNIGIAVAVQSTVITLLSLYSCFEQLAGELDGFATAHVLFGTVSALAALALPRRPDVERHGRLVDAQFAVSVLSR